MDYIVAHAVEFMTKYDRGQGTRIYMQAHNRPGPLKLRPKAQGNGPGLISSSDFGPGICHAQRGLGHPPYHKKKSSSDFGINFVPRCKFLYTWRCQPQPHENMESSLYLGIVIFIRPFFLWNICYWPALNIETLPIKKKLMLDHVHSCLAISIHYSETIVIKLTLFAFSHTFFFSPSQIIQLHCGTLLFQN